MHKGLKAGLISVTFENVTIAMMLAVARPAWLCRAGWPPEKQTGVASEVQLKLWLLLRLATPRQARFVRQCQPGQSVSPLTAQPTPAVAGMTLQSKT